MTALSNCRPYQNAYAQLMLRFPPVAFARLSGTSLARSLSGSVLFYQAGQGYLVSCEMCNLPTSRAKGGHFWQVSYEEGLALPELIGKPVMIDRRGQLLLCARKGSKGLAFGTVMKYTAPVCEPHSGVSTGNFSRGAT